MFVIHWFLKVLLSVDIAGLIYFHVIVFFLMYSVCIHVLLLMDYTTLCTRLLVYIFDVHNLNNIEAIVGKIGDTLF